MTARSEHTDWRTTERAAIEAEEEEDTAERRSLTYFAGRYANPRWLDHIYGERPS